MGGASLQLFQGFLYQMLAQTRQSVITAIFIGAVLSTVSLVFKVLELLAKDTSWEVFPFVLKWAFGIAAASYILHWFFVHWNLLIPLIPK